MKINGIIYTGNYFVLHNQNGVDELGFDIYPKEEAYKECTINSIVEDKQLYKIMELDDNGKFLRVNCILFLDDLKTNFILNRVFENKKILDVLKSILPTNWSILGNLKNDVKTLEFKNINSYNALFELQKNYECFFEFDNIKKQIKVIYLDKIEYNGNYLSEQLNTITTQYTSDSYELANRIYPIGKNGLTISSVNSGKDYIENLEYNKTPISTCIIDEKIEDANELLKMGNFILNEKCKPKIAYKFKIINLSKLDKKDFSLKNLKVNTLVKYLDKKRKKEVFHIVTQYKEYPFEPNKDEITLSSEIVNIASTVNGSVSNINANIENSSIRTFNNSVAYTDDKLNEIRPILQSLFQEMLKINARLDSSVNDTVNINGVNYTFEKGLLKRIS